MTASAVLFSGGLDSAVLLALELTDHAPVWPIHVRAGMAWEDAEARAIARLVAHVGSAYGSGSIVNSCAKVAATSRSVAKRICATGASRLRIHWPQGLFSK